jgi:ABC-2 type transport system permease protein
MQPYCTLTRRELGSYFVSITGYVIITFVIFLIGLSFWNILAALQGQSTPTPITEIFYQTVYFWLILLLSAPVITMRLFALEKYSGTFETLMTAPVSDLQVVLAKFSAALIFYTVMWLPLVGCIFVLRHYTKDPTAMDYGAVGGTFLGIFLIGCLFMSLGCFASAITKSQIIAAITSSALGITLFLLSFVAQRVTIQTDWLHAALNYISITEQMSDFSRGIVDTRWVVFYLSLTIFFLFLTLRVIESRRWK